MATTNLPDQTYLWECLSYDPFSGSLIWLKRPLHHFPSDAGITQQHACNMWNGKYAGREAGRRYMGVRSRSKTYYRHVRLDGRLYLAHRIVWKMATGREPSKLLDHKDGNGLNNALDNLREATDSQNSCNIHRPKARDLPMGVRAVPSGRFEARVRLDGIEHRLGTFDTATDAKSAYLTAKRMLHGDFSGLD